MTRDEATKTVRGAELLIAQLVGDVPTVALLASEVDDPGQLADALIFVAISAGVLVAQLDGTSLRQALQAVPRFDVGLLPHAPSKWSPVIDLAVGVADGNLRLIRQSTSGLDKATVINSAFDLALSATAAAAEKIELGTLELLKGFVETAELDL